LAWLSTPLHGTQQQISAQQFLTHVKQLAAILPEADYAINLCDNRYLFLVSMCAVAVRKQTNLFPSNKNPATQSRLAERYQSAYILHHGQAELSSNLSDFDISHVEWQAVSQGYQVPELSLEHVAVISFTSGSTGDAKPNLKTWRTLRDSTAINAAWMYFITWRLCRGNTCGV